MSQDHFVKEPQAQYRPNPFRGAEQQKADLEQLKYVRNHGIAPKHHSEK